MLNRIIDVALSARWIVLMLLAALLAASIGLYWERILVQVHSTRVTPKLTLCDSSRSGCGSK